MRNVLSGFNGAAEEKLYPFYCVHDFSEAQERADAEMIWFKVGKRKFDLV